MKLKKLLSSLLSTNAAFVILLLLQIFFLIFMVTRLGERFVLVYFLLIVLDVVLLVYITNKNEPISYRMAWIVAISIFPLFGGVSYLFLKLSQQFPKSLDMRNQKQSKESCTDVHGYTRSVNWNITYDTGWKWNSESN